MPTIPPELQDEINRGFATVTPEPTADPTPGPAMMPLPSQEPSPLPMPEPNGRDPVPGIIAFVGFNVLLVCLYMGVRYLFFRH